MDYYGLAQYFSFRCLAGACPSTCCAGWSILVDERDYQRFCRLEPEKLRKDILSHIKEKSGEYFFQNRADGSCAMLDADGLCRIQRNTSEETLCNTCRKYPRLFGEKNGSCYFTMAASCPVVSELLWQGRADYLCGNFSGDISGGRRCVDGRDVPVSRPVWEYYFEMRERSLLYRERIDREELFWDSLGVLSEMLAEILPGLVWGEWKHCERLLLFYTRIPEEQAEKKTTDILSCDTEKWDRFVGAYLEYRFMARQALFDETPEETFCQSMGEVFFVRAACFLTFWQRGALQDGEVCEWIQRVYRICANGKEHTARIKEAFCNLYQEKSLWVHLLLG